MASNTTDAVEARAVAAGPRRARVSLWRILLRIAAYVAPFALAFGVYLGAYLHVRPSTAGDEPHYLLAAESVAYDHDLDLRNDYASQSRTLRIVNVFPLDYNIQAATFGSEPQLRPVHPIGLSIFLAPAVALGGLTGARIAMLLVAALLADQLLRLLRDLGMRRPYRAAAWIAVMFCLPILAFSSQIYPELPGALLVVACLRIMVVGASSPAALALGSAAAGALVWLHVRYVVLSLAAVLGLAIAACAKRWAGVEPADGGRIARTARAVRSTVVGYTTTGIRNWRTVALPVVVPYAMVLGLLAVTFKHLYGSPNPLTPYHAYSSTNVGTAGWGSLYTFTLQNLLNPVGGWIPFAPVQWLGFAALGCLVFWFGWRAAACVGAALAYLLLIASGNPGFGWGLPARYPMIVIPLIAIPIALLIQHVRVTRFLYVPLCAAVAAVRGLGDPRLPGALPARRQAEDVRTEDRSRGVPGSRARPPAHLVRSHSGPGAAPDRPRQRPVNHRESRAATDWATSSWGPYVPLNEGTYRAAFPLRVSGVADKVPVARIEAAGSPPVVVFASRLVTAGEIRAHGGKPIILPFKTGGGFLVETRLLYEGVGTLIAGPIDVQPVRVSAHRAPPGTGSSNVSGSAARSSSGGSSFC